MMRMIVLGLALVLVASSCQGKKEEALVSAVQPSQASGDAAIPLIPEKQPAPTNAAGLIALGNDQMDAHHYEQAIAAYQEALKLEPGNVDVRVDMGTCYRGIGKPEEAIKEYKKAIAINPRHPNAWRNSGVVLSSDLHRNAEAAAAFKTYLEVYPDAPDKADIQAQIAGLKAK